MGKTGIVIDQLDMQNVEYLLMKTLDLIKAKEFVDLVISWVIAAVDRNIKLSLNMQSLMLEVLGGLLNSEESEEYQLDELQISDLNRIYNLLQMNFTSISNY